MSNVKDLLTKLILIEVSTYDGVIKIKDITNKIEKETPKTFVINYTALCGARILKSDLNKLKTHFTGVYYVITDEENLFEAKKLLKARLEIDHGIAEEKIKNIKTILNKL